MTDREQGPPRHTAGSVSTMAAGARARRASARRAVLVLGMHRSGTSAVTRVFNLLGADLPKGLMRPGPDNEAGFWESDDLRIINDEILASGGSSWQDWRPFDRSWYETAQADTFKRRLIELLHRDFRTSSLFVLKDPRICRILPIWLDALAEFGARPAVVIPIRNPIEVAESLEQRDGIAPTTSYLLWLRHVLDAERGTRDLPRTITTYDGLLRDWYSLAGTVAMRSELSWSTSADAVRDEINEFLATRLRHHAATRQQLVTQTDLVDWVKSTYAIMSRMVQAGDDETFLARLDRIGESFETACLTFGAVLDVADETATRQQQARQADQLYGELSATHEVLTDARTDMHRMQVEYDRVLSELATLHAERTKHNGDMDRLSEDVAKLREDLDRRNAELEVLSTELNVLRALSDNRRDSTDRSVLAGDRRATRLTGAIDVLQGTLSWVWRSLCFKQRDTHAKALLNSGLFDGEWYLKRYPDVAAAGYDPLFHYIRFGAWEGRDPHPLFDQNWYQSTYPDVVKQERTPLGHFVSVGAAIGYHPNPLFHTAWYVAHNADAIAPQVNPLRHYVERAAEEGRNPNPLFDSAWYLNENPDVAEAGINPLAHYIHHGIGELRDPHPLFDVEWYLEQYQHVAASGMDPLEHYLTIGAFKGCRPGPAMREAGARRRARRRLRQDMPAEQADNRSGRRFDSAGLGEAVSHPSFDAVDVNSWRMPLRRKPPAAPPFTGQIGVFVHLFYDDLAQEIAASLLNIPFDFKVYVSTNTEEKKAIIKAAFREFGLAAAVKVLPNRGWDIAPFLLGFAEEMREHDICLKLHGKRSRHGYRGERGNAWRKHLLSGLLGHPGNVAYVVDSFSAYPDLGIAMMPHWRGVGRNVNVVGANFLHMQGLMRQIGLSISPDQQIEFPSGSMFWFRRSALAPLFDLGLTWSDFNRCRPRDLDATIAHGVERCVLMYAAKAGFKWAFLPRRWIRQSWARRHQARGIADLGPARNARSRIGAKQNITDN